MAVEMLIKPNYSQLKCSQNAFKIFSNTSFSNAANEVFCFFLQLLSKNAKLTKRFLDIANVVSENSVNDITNLHIDRDCTNLYAQHTS